MTNLVEDLSVLTEVSENTLKKFIPFINYIIGHAIHEDDCKQNNITTIDLGFGELQLKHDGNTLKYRFEPDKELEKLLVQTLVSGRSPMITKLENNLQDKIDRTYKELL